MTFAIEEETRIPPALLNHLKIFNIEVLKNTSDELNPSEMCKNSTKVNHFAAHIRAHAHDAQYYILTVILNWERG